MEPEQRFCLRCGRELTELHADCDRALALEPPRFCGVCARRLRVQVFPDSFRADCPEHGHFAGGPVAKLTDS